MPKEASTTSSRVSNGIQKNSSAFAQHVASDSALTRSDPDQATHHRNRGMSLFSKVAIFIFFPLLVGLLGLYSAILQGRNEPGWKISLDRDFLTPFLLAMAVVIVVGIQTAGFKSKSVQPIVAWPNVKPVQKIVQRPVDNNLIRMKED